MVKLHDLRLRLLTKLPFHISLIISHFSFFATPE